MNRFWIVGTMFISWIFAVLNPTMGIQAPIDPAVSAGQPAGTWQYWNDGSLDPAHRSLVGVSMLTATDGWAVGDQLILRWNGSSWTQVNNPSSQVLNDVVAVASNDAWAIGGSGDILHWNGADWSQFSPVPGPFGLNKLSEVAANDIWAVGYWGTILHWNGSQWSVMTSPTNNHWMGIAMISATDGWAVGSAGAMTRWNGSTWGQPVTPTNRSMNDVSMYSSTDGWAVGDYGTVLHWNGSTWQIMTGSFVDFSTMGAVKAISANHAWVAGFNNGAINIWDCNSSGCNTVLKSNVDGTWYHSMSIVPGSSGTNIWAVGDGTTILHWAGGQWTDVNKPYSKPLLDVAVLSPADGWAVGTLYPIYHGDAWQWNGSSWAAKTSMDGIGLAFSPGSNGLDGWEVGVFGEMYHWSGSAWTKTQNGDSVDLNDVDLLSSTDGWAVGGGRNLKTSSTTNVILHLQNGVWNPVTSPIPDILRGVDMVSSTDGWAVGDKGAMLRWNGSGWTAAPRVVSVNLKKVAMLSSSDGFAVGDDGHILRWNGSVWSDITSPTSADLENLQMISPIAGWAVGDRQILYWDGGSWSVFPTTVYKRLYGISMASYSEGWAVGQNGTFLHFMAPPAQLSINYSSGQPGSFFTLSGANYPPNSTVSIIANGHAMGTINADPSGSFTFILSTSGAENGIYFVTASVNPTATVRLDLDPSAPLRGQEGTGTAFDLPPDIAHSSLIYLPLIRR